LALVHRAEAAGATHEEIVGLALLLNKALQLSEEAARLPSSEARRALLLAQVDDILGRVETEATRLEVTSSHRMPANRVVAYVSGGVAAFLATLACAYVGYGWRRYRVKRMFQMRIFPK
jgi:type IV secretory pathway VirB2 component (pilin)